MDWYAQVSHPNPNLASTNDPRVQDSQGGSAIDPSTGMLMRPIILFMLYFNPNTNQALISFLEFLNVAYRGFAKHHETDLSKGICYEHSNPG